MATERSARKGRQVLRFDDLRAIRDALGKTQDEMAGLLGVSIRAVQSYQQGWRAAPPPTQKLAMLLLYLNGRDRGADGTPCWDVRGCSAEARARCPAYEAGEGELCWVASGNRCMGKAEPDWSVKAARCEQCDVLQRRMASALVPNGQ